MVEKKIDVIGQMILCAIPLIVTPLYAFYKIKMFKKGVLVILLVFAIVIIDGVFALIFIESEFLMLESWEQSVDLSYHYAVALIVEILLPMYFARKWTIEYNEKLDSKSENS